MINILLLLVTIAALAGMVFCNYKYKKASKYQFVALGLLVLVLLSGGLLISRIDTLSLLGLQMSDEEAAADHKFDNARAFKTAEVISKSCSRKGKVLIIAGGRNKNYSGFLNDHLTRRQFNPVVETIRNNEDNSKAAAAEIEKLLAKNKNLRAVVFYGINELEILENLSIYKLPAETRPKIIIVGGNSLNRTLYKRMKDGLLNAAILVDMTRLASGELPEDPAELFDCRYILIDKNNLESNKNFFEH